MTYNQKLVEKVQTDRLGIITYTNKISEVKQITKSDDLMEIKIEDFIYNNGTFIGSVIAKKATIKLINIANKYNIGNENLVDKEINIQTGAILDKGLVTEETVLNDWGNFIITSLDYTSTEETCIIEAYDKMIYLNKEYISQVEYPSTILDIYQSACAQVGLLHSSTTFLNSDFVVSNNQYEGKTCRQVISDIAKMAMGFAKIVNDEIAIQTLGTTPVTNTINKNTIYDLNISSVSSPINKLTLGISVAIGGETTRQDDTSITNNGQNELRLDDIGFLYTSDLRELAIDSMFNYINGFSYLPFNTKYLGYDNVKSGNMITVVDLENHSYNSYVFNHSFTFDGTFEARIETEAMTKSANTYNNTNTLAQSVKKAQIMIDQSNAQITLLSTEKVGNDEIISKINLSPEEISINSNKISLEGYTSINNSFYFDEQGNFIIGDYVNAGKYNLLENSCGILGLTDWIISNPYTQSGPLYYGVKAINDNTDTSKTKNFYKSSDSGSYISIYAVDTAVYGNNEEYAMSKEFVVSPSKQYGFSCKEFADSGDSESIFKIQLLESFNETFSIDKTTDLFVTADLLANTIQQKFTTFTTDSQTVKAKFKFLSIAYFPMTPFNYNTTFRFTDVLIDEQTTLRPWTPNKNEEDYGSIQITRSYLKIFNNNNTEVLTKINKGGVQTNSLTIGGKDIIDLIYPVGSIYMSVRSTSPAILFGGTWSAWGTGRVPVGIDTSQVEFNTIEKTDGSKTHTLTLEQIPSHYHDFTNTGRPLYWDSGLTSMGGLTSGTTVQSTWSANTKSVGGGQAHNNLQPYITCYMWKRTS